MSDETDRPAAVVQFTDCHDTYIEDMSFRGCDGTLLAFDRSTQTRIGRVTVDGVRFSDLASLEVALERLGVPRTQVHDLVTGLGSVPGGQREDVARAWWQSFSAELAAGAVVTGSAAHGPSIIHAILRFLG